MKTEKTNKQKEKQPAKVALKSSSVVKQLSKFSTRGRTFTGLVTRKLPGRVVIEIERTVYVPKYERFYKKKVRIHSKLPDNLSVEVGDHIKVIECRPISKLIHSIVIEKVRSSSNPTGDQKIK